MTLIRRSLMRKMIRKLRSKKVMTDREKKKLQKLEDQYDARMLVKVRTY